MTEQEAMKLLETEWESERSAWESMIKDGITPTEALSILISFA